MPARLTDFERDRQDAVVRSLLHVIPRCYRGDDWCAAVRGIGDAVRDYEPSLGKLEAYAALRARGAVLDERKWGKRANVEPFDERTHFDRRRYRNSRHDIRCLLTFRDIWQAVNNSLLATKTRFRSKSAIQIEVRRKCRQIMRLIFWKHVPQREIARQLGVNETRVTYLKKYALGLVRPYLMRRMQRNTGKVVSQRMSKKRLAEELTN